jgi:transcriptional regulator with XRE-family HTH domain
MSKTTKDQDSNLFPALMKHWRQRRGLSQLDLSLAADVSSRHVSFLETGRAQPSREMILRLANALSIPLRDQNALLAAAGFAEAFAQPGPEEALRGPVGQAIARMLQHHEPFPMVVMDRAYNVLRMNEGASALVPRLIADPSALADPVNQPINGYKWLFDPRLARPYVQEWESAARVFLSRIHRESLERAGDAALSTLLRELLAFPGVPDHWQAADLSVPSQPVLAIRLKTADLSLAFLTTLTVFNAPQNVTLDELRIESYFPLDDATGAHCKALTRSSAGPRMRNTDGSRR